MKLEILSLFQIVTAVLISQAAAVCFNMPDDVSEKASMLMTLAEL